MVAERLAQMRPGPATIRAVRIVADPLPAPLRSIAAIRFAVALSYAALLAGLAVLPSVPAGGFAVSDKLAHAVAYGGQAAVLLWAIGDLLPRPRAAVVAWLGAVAVGAGTEVLQLLAPPRRAEFGDLVADAAGAAVVLGAVLVVHAVVVAGRSSARQGDDR